MIETMISCDKCRRWLSYDMPRTHVLAMARRRGWSVGKKGHYCPACRAQPKASKKGAEAGWRVGVEQEVGG